LKSWTISSLFCFVFTKLAPWRGFRASLLPIVKWQTYGM
jgi:hypothetical protein